MNCVSVHRPSVGEKTPYTEQWEIMFRLRVTKSIIRNCIPIHRERQSAIDIDK